MPLFAAFGVPEVWRYDGSRVAIFRLEGSWYVEVQTSGVLPPLTGALAMQFLQESRELPSDEWLERVRDWAQTQRRS